jgi:two-component system sensor histidine kinase CpxA
MRPRVRSFFVKIFLWFWIAMILVGMSAIISTVTLQPAGTFERWHKAATSPLRIAAVGAVSAYEHGGANEADAYLRRVSRAIGVFVYLFDSRGRELSTLGAPSLAQRSARSTMPVHAWEPRQGTITTAESQSIMGMRGRRYVLVAVERVTLPYHDKRVILRFLIVVLTGGLICAWLARTITVPIAELRRTTKRLAAGELSARVPASVTRGRDEIGQLGRDFDSMAAHLEALITAQRRLLADISHELRSPLARLGVAAALARRSATAAEAPAIDRIELEASRLEELISQLTTLSRLESGVNDVRRVAVDLGPLIDRVIADAEFECRDHGKRIALALDSGKGLTVEGDPELLRRGLENVVRNAIRYTAPETTVEVSIQREAKRISISVRDHGPGVPTDALTEIFRPFYRIGDDRGRDTGGVGLGLAIADRAIRAHGGTISAENAHGGGLVVTIVLNAV